MESQCQGYATPRYVSIGFVIFCPLHSEPDLIGSLQLQHLAGIAWCGAVEPERFENAPDLRNLLGIAFRQLPARQIKAVFETDAHIAAHQGALGDQRHLVPTSA